MDRDEIALRAHAWWVAARHFAFFNQFQRALMEYELYAAKIIIFAKILIPLKAPG
jgi:hypothetical protein